MNQAMHPDPHPEAVRRPRILFIRQGSFSHINDALARHLAAALPDFRIDSVDVRRTLLARHRRVAAINWFHVFATFGPLLLRGRHSPRQLYYRTPWFSRQLPGLLARHASGDRPLFTLATQSLYDAAIPGIPHFIYTDHTHMANLWYPAFNPRDLLPAPVRAAERSAYIHARRVFVAGRHVARSLTQHYRIQPVHCIVAGAGWHTPPAPEPPPDATHLPPSIAFVGSDWCRKGGDTLLQAFILLRRRQPHVRLHIAGCNPGLRQPGIEVLGRVSLQEVSALLARSTVFCMPSLAEPFGVAVLEAAVHRLPVVTTAIGALPDMVQDGRTGRLVPPGNAAALAHALSEYIGDSARARAHGTAGRRHVMDHFGWHRTAACIRDVVLGSLGISDSPPAMAGGAWVRQPVP